MSKLTLPVNEIFTSIKGEGLYTGLPMIFVRLSGCNMVCPDCDTPHQLGYDVALDSIVRRIATDEAKVAVFTGGEPLLHSSTLGTLAKEISHLRIHVESNGTFKRPAWCNWLAVSPKHAPGFMIAEDYPGLSEADEVKIPSNQFFTWVRSGEPVWPRPDNQILYIQPWYHKQFPDPEEINSALELCHKYPWFRYSTQLHKTLGVK